jgi:MSHA biogenesis protein MshL
VITGGLVVDNDSDSTSEVPWLGRIPGIGWAFQSQNEQHTKTRVYAFIRPVILREDKLEQLKFITLKDVEAAGLTGSDTPPRKPLWMQ